MRGRRGEGETRRGGDELVRETFSPHLRVAPSPRRFSAYSDGETGWEWWFFCRPSSSAGEESGVMDPGAATEPPVVAVCECGACGAAALAAAAGGGTAVAVAADPAVTAALVCSLATAGSPAPSPAAYSPHSAWLNDGMSPTRG